MYRALTCPAAPDYISDQSAIKNSAVNTLIKRRGGRKMGFTCLSEMRRPGSGCGCCCCCGTHHPRSRACSLGAARFSSACPSRQLVLIKGAQPLLLQLTCERINVAQKRLCKRCWRGRCLLRPPVKVHYRGAPRGWAVGPQYVSYSGL